MIVSAYIIIKYIVNLEPPIGIYWTIPVIAVLNLISFKMLFNAKEKNPHQFVTAFTLSMIIKFFATAVLLLLCGLLDNENFRPVALSIGATYMVFLFLEVIFVKRALKA
jgi:hypothetical protein